MQLRIVELSYFFLYRYTQLTQKGQHIFPFHEMCRRIIQAFKEARVTDSVAFFV